MKSGLAFVSGLILGVLVCGTVLMAWKGSELRPIFMAKAVTRAAAQAPKKDRDAAQREFELTLRNLAADKDRAKAESGFRRSAELDVTYAPPRVNLARLAEANDDWATACRWQQELADSTEPEVATVARAELTRLTHLQSEWDTAGGQKRIRFERGLARAKVLLQGDQSQEALREAKACTEIDTTRHEPFCVVAMASAKLGEHAQATAALRQAEALAPDSAKELIQKANAELQSDFVFTEAITEGEQQLRGKDYPSAAAAFARAYKAKPERGEAGLRCAMAYVLAGRLDSAKAITEGLVTSPIAEIRREATRMQADIGAIAKQQAMAVSMEHELTGLKKASVARQEDQAVQTAKLETEPKTPSRNSSPMVGERYPQTRLRTLTLSDVSDWDYAQLRYAINEMYARYGMTFKTRSTQAAFEKFSWYKPDAGLTIDKIESNFSSTEAENVKLLGALRDNASRRFARRHADAVRSRK